MGGISSHLFILLENDAKPMLCVCDLKAYLNPFSNVRLCNTREENRRRSNVFFSCFLTLLSGGKGDNGRSTDDAQRAHSA